jgi:hypothetical protein
VVRRSFDRHAGDASRSLLLKMLLYLLMLK